MQSPLRTSVHNSVQRRLDVARERLPQLEAAHLAARAEHQRSLSGESDADPVQSRKAMIDAADEFDLINEAVTTAIPAAIARSSNRLRTELRSGASFSTRSRRAILRCLGKADRETSR